MPGYPPSSFLRVHRPRTTPISSHLDWTNLVSKGLNGIKHQKMIFDLAEASEKSRAGTKAPSCPPIISQDLVHLACSRSESYNTSS